LLALSFVHVFAYAADGIDITQAHIEASEEGYRLSATFSFELNHALEDAINHGIALYFTTQVEMTRPRWWWWFDETTVSAQRTVGISKNLLTNEYQATIIGGVQRSFNTLEEALALLRRPSRWLIAERGGLKSGTYNVAVRMRLDRDYLSTPIHVNAINNSDWRLASDWKYFPFKVE